MPAKSSIKQVPVKVSKLDLSNKNATLIPVDGHTNPESYLWSHSFLFLSQLVFRAGCDSIFSVHKIALSRPVEVSCVGEWRGILQVQATGLDKPQNGHENFLRFVDPLLTGFPIPADGATSGE